MNRKWIARVAICASVLGLGVGSLAYADDAMPMKDAAPMKPMMMHHHHHHHHHHVHMMAPMMKKDTMAPDAPK